MRNCLFFLLIFLCINCDGCKKPSKSPRKRYGISTKNNLIDNPKPTTEGNPNPGAENTQSPLTPITDEMLERVKEARKAEIEKRREMAERRERGEVISQQDTEWLSEWNKKEFCMNINETPFSEEFLIKKLQGLRDMIDGVDINEKDNNNDNCTALHYAASLGESQDIIQALIKNGANVNATGSNGRTEIIKLLIDNKSNVDQRDNRYFTPLQYAAASNCKEAAEFLVNRGAALNGNSPYFTPLHQAARNGSTEVVEFLLSKGQSINSKARNAGDQTPLHMAMFYGHIKTITLLLNSNGVDIHARDNAGRTPLHTAILPDNIEALTLLLSSKADIHARDNAGKTPLSLAEERGFAEIVALLRAKASESSR